MLHLRPLSVGETVDAAFALYRRHFGLFLSTPLVAYVPAMLVWVAYTALVPGQEHEEVLYSAFSLLAGILQGLANVVALGALTRLAADAYLGNPVSRRAAFAWAWRRFWPLLGVTIVSGMVIGIGMLLLLVPGIIAAIVLFGAIPAVVLEQRGVAEALDRSERLAKNAWKQVGLTLLLVYCIVWLPALGLLFAYGVGMAWAFPEAASGAAFLGSTEILGLVANAAVMPFTALGTTLLYYDRRIRAEGFGMEEEAPAPLTPAVPVR